MSEEVHPHSMNWILSELLSTVQARLRLGSNCLQLSKSSVVGRPGSTVGVGVGSPVGVGVGSPVGVGVGSIIEVVVGVGVGGVESC